MADEAIVYILIFKEKLEDQDVAIFKAPGDADVAVVGDVWRRLGQPKAIRMRFEALEEVRFDESDRFIPSGIPRGET